VTLHAAALTELAYEIGESLARVGVRVIALVSTHGGNAGALQTAAKRLNDALPDRRVCVPRGDVGPDPGKHAGAWLTSVVLMLHPELVHGQAPPKARPRSVAPSTSSGSSPRSSSRSALPVGSEAQPKSSA